MSVAIDGRRGLIDCLYIAQFLGLARTKKWLSLHRSDVCNAFRVAYNLRSLCTSAPTFT